MKTLKNIFVFLVICSMTAALYLGIKTELSPEKIIYGTVIAEEGNWTEEGLNLNYHCRIPENTEWIMLLQTHWKNYEIYIDNEIIYSAVNEQTGAYHLFSIPCGKNLRIRYLNESVNAVKDIQQSKVWIGDKSGIYMMLIKENFYAAVFAVLALIFSILSIFAGIHMKTAGDIKNGKSLICLGCYVLCAGIWVLTDSKFLLLLTQKTGVVELVSFLAFFGLPVPLMAFTKIMFPVKEKILYSFSKLEEASRIS